jgi:hypothetical protein
MTVKDQWDAALVSERTWIMGMHVEVILFLSRQEPLVAAYTAMAVLGMLTMEASVRVAHGFLTAMHEAAIGKPAR